MTSIMRIAGIKLRSSHDIRSAMIQDKEFKEQDITLMYRILDLPRQRISRELLSGPLEESAYRLVQKGLATAIDDFIYAAQPLRDLQKAEGERRKSLISRLEKQTDIELTDLLA